MKEKKPSQIYEFFAAAYANVKENNNEWELRFLRGCYHWYKMYRDEVSFSAKQIEILEKLAGKKWPGKVYDPHSATSERGTTVRLGTG